MTTAESNIGNLQTAVSTAQATANSAQQTATTARQQSYVFRYSSTVLVASSTNSNALLDNADNLKVGDKVIDSSGVLFSITAIDTQNSTFTIGTALIDLANDSDVVHKSGDETIAGAKTFSDLQIIGYGTQYKGSRNAYILPEFSAGYAGLAITTLSFTQTVKIGNFVLDANNKPSLDTSKAYIQIATGENSNVNACVLEARNSTSSSLGTSSNKWSKIYGTEYYYGSNNVEFSTKFVTTDTAQTISGNKTFSSINGVEPSSLSLPDLSNGIDISSYIDVSQTSTNYYTPPANGWISISVITPIRDSIQIECSGGFRSSVYSATNPDSTSEYIASIIVPCIKNDTVTIYFKTSRGGTIKYAKFFPCLGNV